MKGFVGVAIVVVSLLVLSCSSAQPAATVPAAQPAATVPAAQPVATVPAAQPTQGQAAVPTQQAAPAKKQFAPGFAVDQTVYEAAQKEGKVVFWSGMMEAHVAKTASKFKELTGIEVEGTRMSEGPVVTRLNQERKAGLYTVDMIQHGNVATWEVYKAQKWLVAYTPEGVKKYAAQFQKSQDKDGMYFAPNGGAYGIGYNTKLITGNDIPKRFADLVDPKYKGKIAMPHAKYSGTGNEALMDVADVLGRQFFEKLKANNIFVVRSIAELPPLLVSGERPISFLIADALVATDKKAGNPVDIVYAEEGVPQTALFSGLVANSPHPNAAKVLQEFLHSPVQQSLMAPDNYQVFHPDATSFPPGMKRLIDMKVLTPTVDDTLAKRLQANTDAFVDLFGG